MKLADYADSILCQLKEMEIDNLGLKRRKNMNIEKAEIEDLQEILDLQYLAYQSEARLLNNMDIPPLKQTLEDVFKEMREKL